MQHVAIAFTAQYQLPFILGVVSDRSNHLKPGTYNLTYNPYLGIQYIANYELSVPGVKLTRASNSLAAPIITAQVNCILNQKHCSYVELANELKVYASGNSVIGNDFLYSATHNEIPVIYLADILTNEKEQQLLLLDLFNRDGYEVLGISDLSDLSDVRVLNLSAISHGTMKEIQESTCACAKVDLTIFFTSSRWLTQQNWSQFEKDSAILISSNVAPTMPEDVAIRQCYIVNESRNVQFLYRKLSKILLK